jgi:hypothetical protein
MTKEELTRIETLEEQVKFLITRLSFIVDELELPTIDIDLEERVRVIEEKLNLKKVVKS